MANQLTYAEHQQLQGLLVKGGYVARNASEEESAVLHCFQQEAFSGSVAPDDSEFEVISMNDASKRRLVAPGAQEENYGASSHRPAPLVTTARPRENLTQMPVVATTPQREVPSIQLPPGVTDLTDWGNTIMEKGKYGQAGMTYEEIRASADAAVKQYVRWLIGAVNPKMDPQFHDLVAYVKIANSSAESTTSGVIPGSSQVRRRKNQ